jgi:hypothetical protein
MCAYVNMYMNMYVYILVCNFFECNCAYAYVYACIHVYLRRVLGKMFMFQQVSKRNVFCKPANVNMYVKICVCVHRIM